MGKKQTTPNEPEEMPVTPQNPEIINVEENGEIWQKCIEFDYTPDPIADGNN